MKKIENEINPIELQNAAQDGLEQVHKMMQLEERLLSEGMVANTKRRPGRRSVINKRVSNKSRQETLQALGIIEASKKLKER